MNDKSCMNRREFLKTCAATTAAAGSVFSSSVSTGRAQTGSSYNAHGLQTRVFGSTGVRIPIIVFGGGSRFCTVKEPDRSDELLTHALDHGFYYWDTAHTYVYDGVCSEERLGRILKHRRNEVFLSTKLSERGYEGAMRELELSLKRLQTDRLDLLQVHSINSLEDVDAVGAPDGVLKTVQSAKEQHIARFIGFTGHASAQAMLAMVKRYDFDTMLIALNHYHIQGKEDFEQEPVPAASRKKMGVLLMKAIRPRETVESLDPNDLIRYALSLEHGHAAVIGTDGMDVLKKNLETARDFQPLTPQEMDRIRGELMPLTAARAYPWMEPGYTDGTWSA
jgi:predicted aldo/keto reductase-like oxidoreductase